MFDKIFIFGMRWKGDQSPHSHIDWPTEEHLRKKMQPLAQRDKQTNKQTDGYCDLKTESAHWDDSV